MASSAIRRLYAPEFLIKNVEKHGDIPDTKTAYTTAFAVAGPSILEFFLIALIMIADTAMVSTVGENAIAAVGLTIQPRFIIQALPIAINAGVTSITARRRGENDSAGANACMKQAMILVIISSSILAFIASFFAKDILYFIGAQADTIDFAVDFFLVIMWGLPIASLSHTICSAQRGIGKTRVSMVVNMVANIVNVAFNYLLVGGNLGFPRLEVKGSGIATVIGWAAGLIVALVSVLRSTNFLNIFGVQGWKFEKKVLTSLYKVTTGSFLEQIAMRAGFLVTAKIVASLGTMMYAAHLIGMNLLSLSFAVGEGFSIAASSLVGRNLGAKRPDLSSLYARLCQRMSIVYCTVLMLVFAIFGKPLYALFSQDASILEVGKIIMIYAGIIMFAQSSQMIFMGSLRGAGDTMYTAMVSLICIMIIRPIATYIFVYPVGMGLVGAWLGLLLDQYLRLLITYHRFKSDKWAGIAL